MRRPYQFNSIELEGPVSLIRRLLQSSAEKLGSVPVLLRSRDKEGNNVKRYNDFNEKAKAFYEKLLLRESQGAPLERWSGLAFS